MPLTRGEGRGTGAIVAVDLVNTWDELEHVPNLIDDLRDIHTWLDHHGLHEAAARLKPRDLDRTRELRSRFDAVFDAKSEAEAAELLNRLSAEYGTAPQLERFGTGWRLR